MKKEKMSLTFTKCYSKFMNGKQVYVDDFKIEGKTYLTNSEPIKIWKKSG
jgi:hypothetical protein